ncbi:hypothetical protein FOXYSP1_15867 [Fusarium oxysporum f. sp. phaseoli]
MAIAQVAIIQFVLETISLTDIALCISSDTAASQPSGLPATKSYRSISLSKLA